MASMHLAATSERRRPARLLQIGLAAVGVLCTLRGASFLLPKSVDRRSFLGLALGATASLSLEPVSAQQFPFGQFPSDWFGYYSDPNHPGCTRKIEQEDFGPMVVIGTDGNPGCLGAGRPTAWRITPKFTPGSDTLVFDFSSKGGPANVEGKWDGTGIVFPDGNKWKRTIGR